MTANYSEWNEQRAKTMLGKRVLIGVTKVLPEGRDTRQMFGTIAAVSACGVEVELEGADAGQTYRLPADLTAFQPASPGDYLLRATGEILADPDFVGVWTIDAASAN